MLAVADPKASQQAMAPDDPELPVAPPTAPDSSDEGDDGQPVVDFGEVMAQFASPDSIQELKWLQRQQADFFKTKWPAAVKLFTAATRDAREAKERIVALERKIDELLKGRES